jgi:hypothetical protein
VSIFEKIIRIFLRCHLEWSLSSLRIQAWFWRIIYKICTKHHWCLYILFHPEYVKIFTIIIAIIFLSNILSMSYSVCPFTDCLYCDFLTKTDRTAKGSPSFCFVLFHFISFRCFQFWSAIKKIFLKMFEIIWTLSVLYDCFWLNL